MPNVSGGFFLIVNSCSYDHSSYICSECISLILFLVYSNFGIQLQWCTQWCKWCDHWIKVCLYGHAYVLFIKKNQFLPVVFEYFLDVVQFESCVDDIGCGTSVPFQTERETKFVGYYCSQVQSFLCVV